MESARVTRLCRPGISIVDILIPSKHPPLSPKITPHSIGLFSPREGGNCGKRKGDGSRTRFLWSEDEGPDVQRTLTCDASQTDSKIQQGLF